MSLKRTVGFETVQVLKTHRFAFDTMEQQPPEETGRRIKYGTDKCNPREKAMHFKIDQSLTSAGLRVLGSSKASVQLPTVRQRASTNSSQHMRCLYSFSLGLQLGRAIEVVVPPSRPAFTAGDVDRAVPGRHETVIDRFDVAVTAPILFQC